MSTKPLKISLIGCGKMGINHLKASKATGLGEVVAIADPMARFHLDLRKNHSVVRSLYISIHLGGDYHF